jgi:hypothetical protein
MAPEQVERKKSTQAPILVFGVFGGRRLQHGNRETGDQQPESIVAWCHIDVEAR